MTCSPPRSAFDFSARLLKSRCASRGIGGTGKDHEESVALGVHDVPVPLSECCAQDLAALRQHTGVAITQLRQQTCGSVDIGEQQRDRTRWQVLHDLPLYAAPVGTADFNDKMDSTYESKSFQ